MPFLAKVIVLILTFLLHVEWVFLSLKSHYIPLNF
jgi:hypothetical protein